MLKLILVLALFLGGGWYAYTHYSSSSPAEKEAKNAPEKPKAIPVTATHAHRHDVDIYLDGLGNVQAFQSVTLHSQIDGKIEKIYFSEGQNVKAGDLLVEIDARSYQAQLDQAQAKGKQDRAKVEQDRAKVKQDEAKRAQDQSFEEQGKAKKVQDQATLANLKVNLKRNEESFAAGAVTQQAVDDQKSLIEQQNAAINADEAAIQAGRSSVLGDTAAIAADEAFVMSDLAAVEVDDAAVKYAQTFLSYSKITSPIDGRTGVRQIDAGNLVRANDVTGIVVITQLQPISVLFSLPQQFLYSINEHRAEKELKVIAMDPDSKTELDQGKLLLVDNQIEQSTGSLRLKATFLNDKGKLWPGGFVDTRLLVETRQNAIVVAAPAVQQGPNGTFVFVINPDQTVEMKTVKVSLIQDGKALITEGVADGDQLVLSGHDRLKPGSTVLVGKKGAEGAPPQTVGDQQTVTGKPAASQTPAGPPGSPEAARSGSAK